MKLLKELREEDVLPNGGGVHDSNFKIRKSTKAVLFNKSGEIALMHVTRENYHKLVGGGLEKGEEIEQALKRELMEETGCTARVKEPIGIIIEYRNKQGKLQISYNYFAEVLERTGEQSLTEAEKRKGSVIEWVSLEKAVEILEGENPSSYTGKFINPRDLTIMREASRLM